MTLPDHPAMRPIALDAAGGHHLVLSGASLVLESLPEYEHLIAAARGRRTGSETIDSDRSRF